MFLKHNSLCEGWVTFKRVSAQVKREHAWLTVQRKSGAIIYRALSNAQSKLGKDRKIPLFILWLPSDKYKGQGWKLPVGRWLAVCWMLLRRKERFHQFALKHDWLPSFCRSWGKPRPGRVCQPIQQRGCTWNHTTPCDQDTSPKSRGNSWKTKVVFYRQKPMAASFPSCLVFMCLRTNFPCKQTCPVSSSSASSAWDRRILPVPTWAQQLLKGEAPQSLSMENSTLKLFKINTGIVALHSPQTTSAVKWNSYLFSVWIFLFPLA